MHRLEARELYRFFHSGGEEVKALRAVDMWVDEGEMVALIGPSGSGKSTLLMCLAGLDEPDGGEVFVMGWRMTRSGELAKTRLRSKTMGVMLQANNLFSHLTIDQNLRLAQELAGPAEPAWNREVLERLQLAGRTRSLPPELSGGERARAAIAAAMAARPKILLLDEPTGEVDADTEATVLQILESHRREGGAIVIATHDANIAGRADRILRMKDGRLIYG